MYIFTVFVTYWYPSTNTVKSNMKYVIMPAISLYDKFSVVTQNNSNKFN